MIFRFRALLAATLLTALVGAPALPAAAVTPTPAVPTPTVRTAKPLPRLSAGSYLVADLATGEVLAARNPHGRFRPASTLKVLTALTLLPQLDPGTVYTAVSEDANVEGSKVGVVPKATYTVHNLFEGLFLMSGNDAANALANAGGGVPATVAAMNVTARELGANDTNAVNPSGLDAPHQLTSSYDLALFARAALERDDFRAYATTVKSKFPGKMPKKNKRRKSFEIYTQNKLVLNYRGAIGVKTGWTTLARGTFVGAATRGDRSLVAVVMRTKGPGWKESAALLDWGFANADAVTAIDSLTPPVKAAAEPESLPQRAAGIGPRSAAAVGSTPSLPWYSWVGLVLAGGLGLMRARVVVLRRRRRSVPALWRQPAR
jgi:D-alanyl-D-alanine carboxypeptidase (penicillin-binding protein 5/6)